MRVPLVDLAIQHEQIADEVRAGWDLVLSRVAFILGPEVGAFERAFAEFSRVDYCIGVANGTDAIELALRATGVGVNDEVILPANTFIATALAVVRAGATPVLVDVDDATQLMAAVAVHDALSDRTKAIVPVHLFGQMAPMAPLLQIAANNGLIVLEDAAQSQGAAQGERPAGGFGVVAATSFYPGKNLGAYGDAGGVLTRDPEIADRVRALRNYGSDVKYFHPTIGFNSRLDTLQAVVLSAKLQHLDAWNNARRDAAARYNSLLADVERVRLPVTGAANRHVWHLYVVRVPDRDRVLRTLNDAGVGAAVHYPVPIHLQGAFAGLGHSAGSFPVTEAAAQENLSLPMYPGITPEQQAYVVEILRGALR